MNPEVVLTKTWRLFAGGILCCLLGLAQAADATQPTDTTQQAANTAPALPFQVKDIDVEGLQRLPVSRVYGLLPIQAGDTVTRELVAKAVQTLYQRGDFEDVQMERDGSTLIVTVSERPSIAKINIKGNKSISTDDLRKGLKSANLLEGDVYKRSTLAGITGELTRQ